MHFLFRMIFLVAFFSSLCYCKYTVYNTCKYGMCANQPLMLSLRFLVNNKLLMVKLLGSEELLMDFGLYRGLAPLTPTLFKDQL